MAVTQTNITWTRLGSSAQFTRVTFKGSTDGVNYNFLGNGSAGGSNWILAGLNFANGQNHFIRARGYHRSGYQNGSESMAESGRNAFFPFPLQILSITRPANGHVILQCIGIPNQVNNLRFSTDLSSVSFAPVSPLPSAADATGAFTYDDANAVGQTKRFYRLAP